LNVKLEGNPLAFDA